MPAPPRDRMQFTRAPEGPGSYIFNKFDLISHKGVKVDLRRLFLDITIYEDITSPTLSGVVSISDAIGMYNNLPVFGEETLDLDFNSQHDGTSTKTKFARNYSVYKVADKLQLKQDLTTYNIYFASKEFEENLKVKVSKAYNGKKSDEIVKLLLQEQAPRGLGSTTAYISEPSFYSENVVIPYWSPFEAINWIKNRTLADANNNAANYTFFENRSGFNFVSIEKLLKQTPKFIYRHAAKNKSELQKQVFGVESYQVIDTQDAAMNIRNGLYSGGLLIHDIVKKKFSFKEYDYLNAYQKTAHTATNPVQSTESDRNSRPYANYQYYPVHYNLFDNMAEGGNRVEHWMLQRKSLLQQLMTYRIVFRVKGNTDLQVGDMITFQMFMQNPENPQNRVSNKYHSGDYLVTAIKHQITHDDYYQTIEVVRDSYRQTVA